MFRAQLFWGQGVNGAREFGDQGVQGPEGLGASGWMGQRLTVPGGLGSMKFKGQ